MDNKFEMKDIKEKKVEIKNENFDRKNEDCKFENIDEIFNLKKKFSKLIFNYQLFFLIISFLLILISSFLLFKSYKSFYDKKSKFKTHIKEIGFNVIISGFLFSFIPVFIIKKLIPRYSIIVISIYYFIIFFFNNGNTYEDHGIYNNIGFFFVTLYFSTIYLSLIWIIKKIRNKNLFILFIFISLLIILFFLFILIHIYNNNFLNKIEPIIIIKLEDDNVNEILIDPQKECLKWGYGLGGKRLENKEESLKNNNSCYMQYPNKCYRFISDNVFDY